MVYAMLVCWLCLLACFTSSEAAAVKQNQSVILILVDGSRWDYVDDPELRAFPEMARRGVKAGYVTPVFPANSYPNWYSIVTGLYSESHGFVQNNMYDMETKEFFIPYPNPTSFNSRWWDVAEPLWVTAEKNGIDSGLYWWVGCDITVGGLRPKECVIHRHGPGNDNETQDVIDKLDGVLDKFQKKELRLALVHYGPVDYTGHFNGPDSAERKRAMYDFDKILASLQEGILTKGLEDEVNVVIVSDHGMTRVDPESGVELIDIESYATDIEYILYYGSSCMILPMPGKEETLYNDLKAANIPGLRVYKKEEIPEKYHFKNNKLVLPVFLLAEKGYFIKKISDASKTMDNRTYTLKGFHGYDPEMVEDMKTIFYAQGPAVKENYTVDHLENVDHYNLVCYMLDLKPLPNNGSVDRIKGAVQDEDAFVNFMARTGGSTSLLPSVLLAFLSLLVALLN